MNYAKHAVSTASIVGVEGRRLFIFIEDYSGDDSRFAFTLNGEPVRATRIAVHKQGIARGLNLIANGTFGGGDFAWRTGGESECVSGINVSPQWTVSGAGTAYLSTANGTPAYIEHLYGPTDPLIPVVSGEHYAFTGYFALHRCVGSVSVDLMSIDGLPIKRVRHQIPRMRGGQSLHDYAKVKFEFAVPNGCGFARLRFLIDAPATRNEAEGAKAYLFFTHISFSMTGDVDAVWRPYHLHAKQIAALSGSAAIVDIRMPRFPASVSNDAPMLDVIDTLTGTSIQNSPFTLPAPAAIRLSITSFDGISLSGEMSGVSGRFAVDLIIDDNIALQRCVDVRDGTPQSVNFRIPDGFLDGGPHIVELRDAATGATFYVNAVTLRALSTSWEQVDDVGRLALPIELHPMSRRRYVNLLAHASLTGSSRLSSGLLGACHDILSRGDRSNVVLSLPQQHEPEVSIVICTSEADRSYRAFAALLFAYSDINFEVIVSTDDTPENVDRLRSLVSALNIVVSPTRLGRAQLANAGAAVAKGNFIVLLDVNAEPSALCIDELRAAFTLFKNVGAVGCKLVKPNGRLVEAGGVLWSSGNRQIVGGNGNAEHPQVNYARHVDYVSDRALMVRADIWREVGGLSEDLFGTSLEDTDLSLKIHAAGYKVVYAPHAVATLHPDTKPPQPKQISAAQFKRRWAQAFQQRPPETTRVRAAMDFGVNDRILFIDQQLPRIDVDAGSYAAVQEMRLFQALGYKVTFLPLNLLYSETYAKFLERIGVEVIYAPFAASVEDVLKERGDEFRLVYVTRHHVARVVVPFVRKYNPQAKIVFNNADLHFLRELRTALALNDGELLRRSRLTRDLELEVMRLTDLTISYNEVEHAVIMSHNLDQTRIAKAPWVVEPSETVPPFLKRANLGFLASFGHKPNVEALKYFATEVMPLLAQSLPEVRLHVYGSQIGLDVTALANDHVEIKGHVDNLADAFDLVKVFVTPLTAGAGLKGKVLNAMAHGVPAVLSPIAAEGIGAQAGIHYLSAQSPEEWVAAIVRLNIDAPLWSAISQSALEFVKNNYSFDVGVKTLRTALEKIDIFPSPTNDALCCQTAFPPLR